MSGTLQNPAGRCADETGVQPGEPLESSPRIAIVTRRLWPLSGDTERDVLLLAAALQQQGARPTLITARWQKNWAEQTTLQGIPVTRLPWPATPGWGLLRYLYSLSRYLRQHRNDFDGVIVQGLRAEAYAAITSLARQGPPVVLRASEAGTHGEVAWQRQTRFGSRIAAKCQQAAAIVAASQFVADELLAANYASSQVRVLAPSVTAEYQPRNEETRESARKALAKVNHDLQLVGGAPVVLCISPLQRERGLESAIRAWIPIQQRWPHARLWIIGEGHERENLFRQICDWDLRYRVVIPGAFDHCDDLLQAADVLLAPAPQPSNSLVLREALASGIAVLASDQAEHRELIVSEKNGLLYSTAERSSLTHCFTRLIEDAELRQRLGAAGRETISTSQETSESLQLRNLFAAERRRQ